MTEPFCLNCKASLTGMTSAPPSPVPHLLGTNEVPSVAECLEIQESITAVQPAISQLGDDILRVQRVLRRLIMEREVLKEYQKTHARFLSPARRVPADIWCEIFSYLLPYGKGLMEWDSDLLQVLSPFHPQHPPALLLQVCRYWRTIALSSSRLWSLIVLCRRQVPPDVVQTWLERSHQTALRVILKPSSDKLLDFFRGPATHTLFGQSHRWQSASMTVALRFPHVYSPLADKLSELEELHLDFDGPFPTQSVNQLQQFNVFSNAPKLRRVTIYRPTPFHNICLPWVQLTHFSLKHLTGVTSLRILLESAPHLIEVECPLAINPRTEEPLIMQHSCVRNFSISINDKPGTTFDCLSLPSLRTLAIKRLKKNREWIWPSFEPFILRSCQALESLKLVSVVLTGADIIACLRALPSLSRLNLSTLINLPHMGDPIEQLLQALYCTPSGTVGPSVLVPRMKTISISCAPPDIRVAAVVTKFVDMIRSRCPAVLDHDPDVSPVESASLFLPCGRAPTIDPIDSDHIQKLKSKGMKVQVSSRGNFDEY